MCNFYMMYYTNSSDPVRGGECWGNHRPQRIYPDDIDQLAPYPGYAGQGKNAFLHHLISTIPGILHYSSLNCVLTNDF